jgi:hypothetical protein
MVSLDCGLLDRPVHPFDLSVGPGMLDLGEPVFDPVSLQRMSNMCVIQVAVGPSA